MSVAAPSVPGMTEAWAAVRSAIDAEDAAAVAALVAGLGRDGRHEVARELPGRLPVVVVRPWRWLVAMRVAGCGAIGGAAAVASWLCRRELRVWGGEEIAPFLLAISSRPPEWRADLALRLARRVREPGANAELALGLLRATGAEPPAHDPLVHAWFASVLDAPAGRMAAALRADPLLDAMLPRLFEAGGVLPARPGAPEALVSLTLDGRVPRATLLDGCLSRFLRRGSAAELRFFAGLHELLAPAADEVAARRRAYLALLPSAPGPVADLALRHLRRLGALPPGEAREAVDALLHRAEGRLISAGLGRLDRLAAQDADVLDAFATGLSVALGAGAGETRHRAARLVVRHAARFTPAGAEPVLEAARLMPGDEGAEAVAALTGTPLPQAGPPESEPPESEPPESEPFVPLPLRGAPAPERWAPPTLAAGWLGRARLAELDWRGAERWLDAFVRLAATDRAGLKGALAMPGLAREPGVPPPDGALPEARFAEVHRALAADALPPYLLATPTHADGRLDPGELVSRLEGYERGGVEALPVDLRQALLRLPREAPGDVAERAARLEGPAGRAVAGRLAGTDRPAEPCVTVRWEGHATGPRVSVTGLPFEPAGQGCDALLGVMPAHREAVAGRLVGDLAAMPSPDDLRALAAADGPAGDAVALILAHHLCAGARGGAVAPMLWLAASGDLPGEAVGRQLAALFRHGAGHSPSGAMAALRSAARQGAHLMVWEAVAALLGAALPGPGERATGTHTRLVAFAAEAAGWADARGAIPAVARLAAGQRVTGLVRECRRLHALLTA